MSHPPSSHASSPTESGYAPENAQIADAALVSMAELEQELNRLQRTIRLTIQSHLAPWVGRSMGCLQQNRILAKKLHALLDSHGLRVMCSECGRPAILRVSPRRGVAEGVFVFDHTIDGRRTFHGGKSTLPPLHLVAKLPRATRRDQDDPNTAAAERAAG